MRRYTADAHRPHRRLTRRHLLQASLALGGGGLVLAGCSRGATESAGDESLLAWPGEDRWPAIFAQLPPEVHAAYRYAVANEAILQYMPCFCGCGIYGHRSNFDCYVAEVRDDGAVLLDPMSFG